MQHRACASAAHLPFQAPAKRVGVLCHLTMTMLMNDVVFLMLLMMRLMRRRRMNEKTSSTQ